MAAFRFKESDVEPARPLVGALELAGRSLRIAARAGSRLSLQVTLLDGEGTLADGTELDGLTIETPAGAVRLGRCRFSSGGRSGREGRLVFLETLYDCRAALEEGRVVDLCGAFGNLPLVLSQKDRIHPEFREYVAGLVYDLSVYKRFFDDEDRLLEQEPADVAEAARDAIIRGEGRRFLSFFDRKLEELAVLVRGFTREEHERHGFYLRRQVWPYILASSFLKRTNLKPRGYAGDAEMMQMIYEDRYAGSFVFNRLLHKHPIESAAAQAVRNRRRLVPQVLREVLARFPELPHHGFRFLSLASGPAWEMQDLFLGADDFERFSCTLLDQDEHALGLARAAIEGIERDRNVRIDVRYLQDSVRTMLRTRDMPERFGRYHFIYSMGLFDYLTPPVARAVLAKVFDLVEPGGTLVVGNYHVRNPTRLYMDYWMDWVLYYRTEASVLALAEGLPARNARVTYDSTGSQMFLHLDRPA